MKNASFKSIDVIHIWLNEVIDIIDRIHLKELTVEKLFFFFFIFSIILLPSFLFLVKIPEINSHLS